MGNIEIVTDRFVLRTLFKTDVSLRYLNWVNGEDANPYIAYEGSFEQLQNYVEEKSSRENILFLGIFSRETLLHIGNIKYEPVDIKNQYANLGILIGDESWQGVGVGPEVIKASAKWLQEEKGIQQIVLRVKIINKMAIKAYKKVGFEIQETPYIHKIEGVHFSMIWNIS